MKFYIETLGCKVNSYESDYIKKSLVNNGFLQIDDYTLADVVIINTCTVTNQADNKSLKRVRKLKRECKNARTLCRKSNKQNSRSFERLFFPQERILWKKYGGSNQILTVKSFLQRGQQQVCVPFLLGRRSFALQFGHLR